MSKGKFPHCGLSLLHDIYKNINISIQPLTVYKLRRDLYIKREINLLGAFTQCPFKLCVDILDFSLALSLHRVFLFSFCVHYSVFMYILFCFLFKYLSSVLSAGKRNLPYFWGGFFRTGIFNINFLIQ